VSRALYRAAVVPVFEGALSNAPCPSVWQREPKWNPVVVGRAGARHRPAAFTLFALRQRDQAMSILISILITFLVVILVLYLINMLPIEGRAKQIVRIIVIIIGILSLLKYLGVGF
jgi:hypothetical protein